MAGNNSLAMQHPNDSTSAAAGTPCQLRRPGVVGAATAASSGPPAGELGLLGSSSWGRRPGSLRNLETLARGLTANGPSLRAGFVWISGRARINSCELDAKMTLPTAAAEYKCWVKFGADDSAIWMKRHNHLVLPSLRLLVVGTSFADLHSTGGCMERWGAIPPVPNHESFP